MLRPCLLSFTWLALGLSLSVQATDFSRLYKEVSDSVVLLKTNQFVEKVTPKGVRHTKQGGLGSGVLIKDGYILTAAHVVHIADTIQVETRDGQIYAAKTVSSIPLADLAVIRIINPPASLKAAKLGNSDKAAIGSEVIVVGAPYGLSQTLTVGHLSGRRINDGEQSLVRTEFLQTDAPINQGNSGGPMFNSRGEVIGIVSHIRSKSGGNEGLGFAASVNMARTLFLDNPPFWSGMEYIPMSTTLAAAINVPYNDGLLVQEVAIGSVADKLGLRSGTIPAMVAGQKLLLGGDVIVELGGQKLSLDAAGLERAKHYYQGLGDKSDLELTVYRSGEIKTLKVNKKALRGP